MDQPLPLELIIKIVKFRVSENLKKADSRNDNAAYGSSVSLTSFYR
jgi:hypothetical protein